MGLSEEAEKEFKRYRANIIASYEASAKAAQHAAIATERAAEAAICVVDAIQAKKRVAGDCSAIFKNEVGEICPICPM